MRSTWKYDEGNLQEQQMAFQPRNDAKEEANRVGDWKSEDSLKTWNPRAHKVELGGTMNGPMETTQRCQVLAIRIARPKSKAGLEARSLTV